MKQVLSVVLICFLSVPLHAQEALLAKMEAADAADDGQRVIQIANQLLAQPLEDSIAFQVLDYKIYYQHEEGDMQGAIESIERSIPLSKDTSTLEFVELLCNNANILHTLGQLEEAIVEYKRALQIARKEEYKRILVHLNNDLGYLYEDAGANQFALNCYKPALKYLESASVKDTSLLVETLHNIARVYELQHRYDESESIYKQVIPLAEEAFGPQSFQYTLLLNNLGIVYFFKEEYEKAIRYFKPIKDLVDQGKIPVEENSVTICNLADCYAHLGKYELAEQLYQQMLALELQVYGESYYNYAVTLTRLGELYHYQGKNEAAREKHLKALELVERYRAPQSFDFFYTSKHAANFFLAIGDWDQAIEIAWMSLEHNSLDKDTPITKENIAQQAPTHGFVNMPQALSALQVYGRASWQLYHKNQDLESLQTAYRFQLAGKTLLKRTKNSFTTELDKLQLLRFAQEISELGLEISRELYAQKGQAAYLESQFQFIENNKYILLQDALQAREAQSLGKAPQAIIDQEAVLEQELLMARKLRIQASNSLSKNQTVARYNKVLQEYNAFKEKIEQQYPDYYSFKYKNETVLLKSIQEKLSDKSLLLEYFIGEGEIYVMQLRSSSVDFIQLPLSRDSTKKQVRRLRKALSDYAYINEQGAAGIKEYADLSFWFYEQLIAPALKEQSDVDHLVIVPDGLLGHVPFETFITEVPAANTGFKDLAYLLKKYKVNYQYSAHLLTETVNSQKGKGIFALAASYEKGLEGLSRTPATRSNELRSIRNSLQPLPAAEQEVRALEQQLKGTFLYGDAANEASFKAAAGDFAILHLAMHGLLNGNYPILSSLAFTENSDSTEDNFLQAWEIAQLELKAELVVLSACETGYGKFRQGEGVMSLARSFMYAGVPSMVVSLWQVNDASTSIIMQRFYDKLAKGMDKAVALQEAKLDYISNVDKDLAAHPAFWAPFIQLGDSRPVKWASKGDSNWIWWAVGAGGLLILVLGVSMMRRKTAA